MLFEWDDNKDHINQQKHGISFETASKIFNDPFLITIQDRVTNGEIRWQSIGSLNGFVVILVAHTYTDDNGLEIIPIISARKLSKGEIKKYGYH